MHAIKAEAAIMKENRDPDFLASDILPKETSHFFFWYVTKRNNMKQNKINLDKNKLRV